MGFRAGNSQIEHILQRLTDEEVAGSVPVSYSAVHPKMSRNYTTKSLKLPIPEASTATTAPEMLVGLDTGGVLKKVTLQNGKVLEIIAERGTQLKKAKAVRVNLHFVVSPQEIYLRTPEQSETYRYLEQKMHYYYETKAVKKCLDTKFKLEVGAECAVLMNGTTWNRAEIVSLVNHSKVLVHLFDEAEIHAVHAKDIRHLTIAMGCYGKTVTKVALDDVFPLNGTTWDPEVNK